MRTTIILLFALFAGTAFAQAPVIDSMLIDEAKGILSVYGDFGTAQGKVWCDSVELPVLTWNASLVTATIPDSGKGSAGGVAVETLSGTSKDVLISKWNAKVEYNAIHSMSQGAEEGTKAYFYLSWRYDVHSVLKSTSKARRLKFQGMKISHDYQEYYYIDPDGNGDANKSRDTGFHYFVMLDTYLHQIDLDLELRAFNFGQSFYTPGYLTDTVYNLLMGYKGSGSGGVGAGTTWDSNKIAFAPPLKAIALINNPSIIAPKNEHTNIGTNDILLQWYPLKYMDAYHIQLSKDSLINGQRAGQAQQGVSYIVDTIVSSLDFALPPLEKNTKYYWRVCGVNTEGESRWSDVWSFTTGTSADVKQEGEVKSLRVYPNPATSEVTIITPEPTRLLLYDVTGKIVKSEQATSNQMKWDVSLLPNGTYILGTSSGDMQVVQIAK